MTKLTVIEAHTVEALKGGYSHECHAEGCQDVNKKSAKVGVLFNAESVTEAIEIYEGNNEAYIAEGGTGYDWNEMVKVYPCTRKVA